MIFLLLTSHLKPVSSPINKRDANLTDLKMVFFVEKIHVRKRQTEATKASKQRINTFFMFSLFFFFEGPEQSMKSILINRLILIIDGHSITEIFVIIDYHRLSISIDNQWESIN